MKLVSGIVDSGFFAQSALSAEVATKDSLGRNISETYLTGVDLTPYQTTAGMTAYQSAGSYLTADALDNVSSTWNTVTDKLDSTAFSTVSGNFLTAHQSLPSSANWNATYNTVNGNSATWNSTYDTVHDNSASWTGGGASVTSPRGTINVNGDEIEGTNSAVLTGTAGGYERYLQTAVNHIETNPATLTYDSISITSQTGGTLVIPIDHGDPSLYITVTGETNGGGTATASGQGSAGGINFVYIPLGEMIGPFTAQASYWINLAGYQLTASAAPTTGITGVGELAWNSALDSVRNTSAAWNSTYSTVAINSASWGAGTEYSAGSGIDITDDVISLTNPLTLVPSGDVTIDVTGNSAVISVNAGTSYTGDAQGALDEVYTNSGNWNTVTDKLNTTAFSTVSGNFLTAHQALPNSGNWDSTYTTVSDNSASWGAGSTYTGDAQGALDEVYSNSANWNGSYDTLTANSAAWTSTNNTVSNRSGNWNQTYTAVTGNSAFWGGPVLNVSAGPGVKINLVDDTIVFGADETVLYSGTAQTSAITFSEPLTAFERILVAAGQVSVGNWGYTYLTNGGSNTYYAGFTRFVGGNNPVQIGGCILNVNSQHTSGNLNPCGRHWFPTTTAAGGGDTNQFYFTKVIGINRTAGNN